MMVNQNDIDLGLDDANNSQAVSYEYYNMIESDDVLEGISLIDQLTPSQLKKIRDVRENTIDLTIPFHNYTGPGTRLYENIIADVRPVDDADKRSLLHDVRYSLANTKEDILYADSVYDTEDKTMLTMNSIEIGVAKKLLQLKNILAELPDSFF